MPIPEGSYPAADIWELRISLAIQKGKITRACFNFKGYSKKITPDGFTGVEHFRKYRLMRLMMEKFINPLFV
jgi:hypothetical protein